MAESLPNSMKFSGFKELERRIRIILMKKTLGAFEAGSGALPPKVKTSKQVRFAEDTTERVEKGVSETLSPTRKMAVYGSFLKVVSSVSLTELSDIDIKVSNMIQALVSKVTSWESSHSPRLAQNTRSGLNRVLASLKEEPEYDLVQRSISHIAVDKLRATAAYLRGRLAIVDEYKRPVLNQSSGEARARARHDINFRLVAESISRTEADMALRNLGPPQIIDEILILMVALGYQERWSSLKVLDWNTVPHNGTHIPIKARVLYDVAHTLSTIATDKDPTPRSQRDIVDGLISDFRQDDSLAEAAGIDPSQGDFSGKEKIKLLLARSPEFLQYWTNEILRDLDLALLEKYEDLVFEIVKEFGARELFLELKVNLESMTEVDSSTQQSLQAHT